MFEAREYVRHGRWQQSCYYGADRLAEYKPQAYWAWQWLPTPPAVPLAFGEKAVPDRDVWTLALYRLALDDRTAFKLDLFGEDAAGASRGRRPGAGGRRRPAGPEGEDEQIAAYQGMCEALTGRCPDVFYATLRRDVFAASLHALDVLCERAADTAAPPLTSARAPRWTRSSAGSTVAGRSGGGGGVRVAERNGERNRHLYQRWEEGATLAELLLEVQARPDWSPLSRLHSIHTAIKRYAADQGLTMTPRRCDGHSAK